MNQPVIKVSLCLCRKALHAFCDQPLQCLSEQVTQNDDKQSKSQGVLLK